MWSPKNRHFCAKSIEKSRKQVKNGSFSADFWSKWRDSNSRPPVPETGALPTALHLEMVKNMRFSVSGQTCGQTEDLRNFRQSGVPKKSVFSRGFSVFQKINFEIGGLHPNVALYQAEPHLDGGFFVIFCKWSNMWSDRRFADFSAFGRAEKVSIFKGSRRFGKSQNGKR